MLLKDENVLIRAKSDTNYMDDLMRNEEVEKFIKYVIKSFTKNPAFFMQQNQVEWEDLYQACLIGLFNGIKKLDLERAPNEWIRFLYLNIQGEIRNFSRSNQSNSIGISQRIREKYPKYISFYNSFRVKFNKDPSIEDTIKELNISRNDAFDLVYGMQQVISFYQNAGKVSENVFVRDLLKDPLENLERTVLNRILVQQYMSFLSDQQKEILYLYYFIGFNKSEIARMLGCGNSTIQRHIGNAFEKIKEMEESA